MKAKRFFIIIVVFLLFVNFPLTALILDDLTHQNRYKYSTGDGFETGIDFSGMDTKGYPHYKILHTINIDSLISTGHYIDTFKPGLYLRQSYPNADTVVYRIFKKDWIVFWRWGLYLFYKDPIYDFPYKSWDEIKKHRPKDFVLNPRWQAF